MWKRGGGREGAERGGKTHDTPKRGAIKKPSLQDSYIYLGVRFVMATHWVRKPQAYVKKEHRGGGYIHTDTDANHTCLCTLG